jgi:hypothetical protein
MENHARQNRLSSPPLFRYLFWNILNYIYFKFSLSRQIFPYEEQIHHGAGPSAHHHAILS